MKFHNQMIYKGPFLNDKMHGLGRLMLPPQGIFFEGQFEQNVAAGMGKLCYPNGDIYYGQHSGFVREGHGKMLYADGSSYEGIWLNDKRHTKGWSYEHSTGNIYCGEYQDGKRVGKGRMLYGATQEIYDGNWSSDKRQGEGLLISRDGTVRKGDFRADHMESKVQHVQTLTQQEADKVFDLMRSQNGFFIETKILKQ
jgi:hypothetical protein